MSDSKSADWFSWEPFKVASQLCFCAGKGPLPPVPLAKHNPGCLVWDWALSAGKVTAAERMKQLDNYAESIGDRP